MEINTIMDKVKLTLSTLAIVASSIVGTYTFITNTFVTQTQAAESIEQLNNKIDNLSQSNTYNRLSVVQLQLLRLEQQKELSLTEKRMYDNLKTQETELIKSINKNN